MSLNQVGYATTTMFPNFSVEGHGDQVRGTITLRTFLKVRDQGYKICIIDGGSDPAYLDQILALGLQYYPQKEKGISAARRQGVSLLRQDPQITVINSAEPEKEDYAERWMSVVNEPILLDQADIVVPGRTLQSFATMPPFQVQSEQRANQRYNETLREKGVLTPEMPDFDWFHGPKAFSVAAKRFFMNRYEVAQGSSARTSDIRPWQYSEFLFWSIVNAINAGLRVLSVPVSSMYPAEQTAFETGNSILDAKRDMQATTILDELEEYMLYLDGNNQNRLKLVGS